MKWFGKPWGAPLCREFARVETPTTPCAWCEEPFTVEDGGVEIPCVGMEPMAPLHYHVECFMRTIVGGLNHVRGECTCCGGTDDPDPDDMTKREASKAAVDEWIRRNQK